MHNLYIGHCFGYIHIACTSEATVRPCFKLLTGTLYCYSLVRGQD